VRLIGSEWGGWTGSRRGPWWQCPFPQSLGTGGRGSLGLGRRHHRMIDPRIPIGRSGSRQTFHVSLLPEQWRVGDSFSQELPFFSGSESHGKRFKLEWWEEGREEEKILMRWMMMILGPGDRLVPPRSQEFLSHWRPLRSRCSSNCNPTFLELNLISWGSEFFLPRCGGGASPVFGRKTVGIGII